MLGYQGIAVAGNGNEALDALAQNDFDLVLMDCQMPEMDGYEAARQIRNPSSPVRNHQIPIIAMTANALAGDRQKCLDAGMNDHVSKPILRDALARALDRWLKERRSCEAKPTTALASNPPPSQNGAEIFDREGLLDRVMGNTQLAHRVVARFLLDMPQQLLALSAALSSQDAKTARLAAHSIKGAAANVGGVQVRRAAQALEAVGETGNFAEVDRLLPALNEEWERFRTETEPFLESGPGSR
jgi:CheY-like chemotaxis protein/HPt (histidine-containing phosphotransfer) domain-containing protein